MSAAPDMLEHALGVVRMTIGADAVRPSAAIRAATWPRNWVRWTWRRGACSWCVPVDPEREPEYWASHWRRFTERR